MSLPRKLWDGDVLPNFETHLEIFGSLCQVVAKFVRCRGTVEGRIVPHYAKERFAIKEALTIFIQTFPCKSCLCILPLVDLAVPALIGPCGSAKTNQRRERHGDEDETEEEAGRVCRALPVNTNVRTSRYLIPYFTSLRWVSAASACSVAASACPAFPCSTASFR